MSQIALVGLVVLWVIVLGPDILRRSAAMRRVDPINEFQRNRSVLGRSGAVRRPGPQVIDLRGPQPQVQYGQIARTRADHGPARSGPVRRSRAEQRRQEVLTVLGALALLSFLGFAAFGGVMLVVHVIADVLLVAYVALWLTVTKRDRARSEVTPLYPSRSLPGYSLTPQRQRIAR